MRLPSCPACGYSKRKHPAGNSWTLLESEWILVWSSRVLRENGEITVAHFKIKFEPNVVETTFLTVPSTVMSFPCVLALSLSPPPPFPPLSLSPPSLSLFLLYCSMEVFFFSVLHTVGFLSLRFAILLKIFSSKLLTMKLA